MGNQMFIAGLDFITGIDFVCAALTLAYIGRLLFQSLSMHNAMAVSWSVAKVSLRGQQIAPRLR